MKTKIVEPGAFAQAVLADGPMPFLPGEEHLAAEYAAMGGGLAVLLSQLLSPQPVVREARCEVLAETV